MRNGKFLAILMAVALVALSATDAAAIDRANDSKFGSGRSPVYARNGMAATSQPLATQTALDILKKGGSAVDAAIAANAVLGLVEPTGAGIGGDLFAIVWSAKDQRLYGLNASGRSPKKLTLDAFKRAGHEYVPYFGPLTITVPGAVDGWFELHGKFGKLPMADNLAPAIHYAREGAPIHEVAAAEWVHYGRPVENQPGFKEVFYNNGRPYKAGEYRKAPALADSLEKIARGGRDVFYKGEIARKMVDFLKKNGGYFELDDFATHKSEWVDPVSTNYRGYDVWEMPPNGQGITVLQMLNILETFDIAAMGPNSPDYWHVLMEAKKLAWEDRARFIGDPAFNKNKPGAKFISKDYGRARARLIDMKKAAVEAPAGDLPNFDPRMSFGGSDTVYLTVADKDGNMVSFIQSNFAGFGSGLSDPDLGFCFHNRGHDFDIKNKGRASSYAPGKRPFHTIIPAFVTKDGKPWMSYGVMGGSMQPQGHVQLLVNMVDFGMNIQEASDFHRLRHNGSSEPNGYRRQAKGGVIHPERDFPKDIVAELERRGHVPVYEREDLEMKFGFGGFQGIRRLDDGYVAGTDARKDGYAGGY